MKVNEKNVSKFLILIAYLDEVEESKWEDTEEYNDILELKQHYSNDFITAVHRDKTGKLRRIAFR